MHLTGLTIPNVGATEPAVVARALKRAIDILGAAVGLFVLAPLLVGVALVIRLSSRGPMLFLQRRLGQDRQAFWVMKFRTMVPDAELRLVELESLNESAGGVLFKMRHDPRVTRIGRFLRRTSIDELPQLINVLRGEMSLIGPRPLQLRDCELLEAHDPVGFARRLRVKPGLSGPWQVGGRSDVDFQGMIEMDLDYIDNWSLGRDLGIIVKTVGVVLACRGAR